MAGAPVGNQNAAKAKVWHAAIMRALDKRGSGDRVQALDELAGKLLDLVATGDLAALKEFGDRLDGKPAQIVIGDSNEDPIQHSHTVEWVNGAPPAAKQA
jgi:hypothetical protein